MRKQKLEKSFREEIWASLRKGEQARLSADQVPLSPQEYAARLDAAYDEAMRASSASNALETARASSAGPTTDASSSSSTQKGASALLQKPVSQPKITADEKERFVLNTVQVTDADLTQLAAERAGNARQRILDSGKVDADRLFVVDLAANPCTNHTARVLFHLQ